MKTIENNKLIAEFMGVFDKILSTGNMHSWSDAPFYYTTEDTREKVIKNISKYSKYNKDWNWLMEVVEKIESLEHWTETLGGLQNICLIGSINSSCESFKAVAETKIEAVYNACLEFIKWYNEQNKNNEKHTCIIDK